MQVRRRIKHDLSFEDRLAMEANRLREQATQLPMGQEREELLRKAREADTAAHINEWLSSRDCKRQSKTAAKKDGP